MATPAAASVLTALTVLTTFTTIIYHVDAVRQPRAAARPSPFADLTMDDMNAVVEYLNSQDELNLTPHSHAKVSDSYIFLIEALRPWKKEALLYLSGSGSLPQRAARVVLHRGDLASPEVQEYKVWPLPTPTNHEQIRNPSWKHPIPFTSRSPIHEPEEKQFLAFAEREITKVNHILREATSGWTYGSNCTEKCLTWLPGVPPYVTSNSRKVILYLIRNVEGGYLHPIGLQFVIDIKSLDDTQWSVDYVWFRTEVFRSFEEMVEAAKVKQINIQVMPEPEGVFTETLRSSLNFRGTPRPAEATRGPRSVYPDEKRFTVSDRSVSWLGWEFEFSMLSSSGIQLHDIKFLGDRIAYELSLQEVSVFYSGTSPLPSHTTYHDSVTVLGLQTSEMFPGIDCPSRAHFFSFVHFLNGKPHLFKNGACVFEHDRGIPLRRHFESNHKGGFYFAQGMPDNVLIFRHILTVYNYDYVIDVMFHQAGQIEGKVSLTGYLLNSFYSGTDMDKDGHVVNEDSSIANIHHHIVNIKVDLDILGTANRFETLDIELENVADELNQGTTLLNRKVTRNLKSTEQEAGYEYDFNKPKYLIVYNDKEKNRFGQHRGFRILSEGMSKVLLPKTYRGYRSRAWAQYQVAITKYKDTEQCSSSIYATMEPYDPVMSFEDFMSDNEDILDQDLVAWLTLGAHHIPHTEDVPIVTTPGVQLTFFLLPYNYFDEDPSLASRDNIRVTPGADGNEFKYSGVPAGGDTSDEGCAKAARGAATKAQYGSAVVSTVVTSFLAAFITRRRE